MKALKSVSLTDTPRGPIKFDHLGNVIGYFYIRRARGRGLAISRFRAYGGRFCRSSAILVDELDAGGVAGNPANRKR
jgi:hypothetical protein